MNEKKTIQIKVGKVGIGSKHPISVQSMTNTLTSDAESTIVQIKKLEEAGADLVRVSCPDVASTEALKKIISSVKVPIIADIHFHYKRALEAADSGLSANKSRKYRKQTKSSRCGECC